MNKDHTREWNKQLFFSNLIPTLCLLYILFRSVAYGTSSLESSVWVSPNSTDLPIFTFITKQGDPKTAYRKEKHIPYNN